MNRRVFLKTLGVVTLVSCMPSGLMDAAPAAESAVSAFDPTQKYRQGFAVSDYLVGSEIEFIKELEPYMEEVVPFEYRSNVKWIVQHACPSDFDPLAQRSYISWEYNP